VHPNIFVLASELQQIHNETYIKMREVTTRWLKKISNSKKRGQSRQKIGEYSANPISRICSYNKTNEMHKFLKFIFGIEL
jgi:hypothetical protein